MALRHLGLSRRSLAIAAALLGTVSLALGAPSVLNKRAPETAKAVEMAQVTAAKPASRLALVIGNGKYPDANAPLTQPINDARAIGAALRREGFEVDLVENAGRDAIERAVDRLTSRINAQSVVLLFFGGYGIQAGRESFMIPVDAAIWKESDVRSKGVSIEAVLGAIKEKGARARIAVIDASRRNPFERRFRGFSHGLAPISAPENALILSSAAPGKVADDSKGHNSVLVTELLNNIGAKAAGAEAVFNKTRLAVSRASGGEQVPSVSSSLLEDIDLAAGADEKSGG
ncbi:MAG TPA: caspase family protein [Bradyrhizobium sp.]|nr:caspase family protein [Bradyrhizobium sp.]